MNKIKNPLVIVANGEFPTHSIPIEILENSTSILACDGATNQLVQNGYTPNMIIGDLDSISKNYRIKFENIIIKKANQNSNDLRKAINYALDNNIMDISIIGASGKREDHIIANIFSLLYYKDLNIKLFTDEGCFSCIHESKNIESFKGQQVSIFSIDQTIRITSNNLMYNFNQSPISTIYSGTLNESTSDNFKLKISHGSLLIFQTY